MTCDHENLVRLEDTVFCADCSEIIIEIAYEQFDQTATE